MRPLSKRTHERDGRCTLCGRTDRLTKTHVPPKAAFNSGKTRRGIVTAAQEVLLDREREGGNSVWAHCEACRAATSPWDDEYIHWARVLAGAIWGQRGTGANGVTGPIPAARPGRFIRAALAGMTGVAEGLINTHPDLIKSILRGTGTPAENSLRVLIAVTPTTERAWIGGMHGGVQLDLLKPAGTGAPTPAAVIHHLPISLVLVDRTIAPEFPHEDCTDWLAEGADDMGDDLTVTLPAVRLKTAYPLHPSAFEIAAL